MKFRASFKACYRIYKVGEIGVQLLYWTGDDWSSDPDELIDEIDKDYYGSAPLHQIEYLGMKKIRKLRAEIKIKNRPYAVQSGGA